MRDDSLSESAMRFTLTSDVGRDWQFSKDNCFVAYKNDIRNLTDDSETYIVRSTNSIDCKPYYDCFKNHELGEGCSGIIGDFERDIKVIDRKCIIEDHHSDTYADYRKVDNDNDIFRLSEESRRNKFRFNRSLNSCQIKNKRKINSSCMY